MHTYHGHFGVYTTHGNLNFWRNIMSFQIQIIICSDYYLVAFIMGNGLQKTLYGGDIKYDNS